MSDPGSGLSPKAAVPFIPAQEVIIELEKSALPREAKAAMAALSVETLIGTPPAWPYSWSPFRCEFGFLQWTGPLDTFPAWGGDAAHNTHAFGVWQDEPATYAEIAALTGKTGVTPQEQIHNNWVLAVRDFGDRSSGRALLAELRNGNPNLVSTALKATWPGGADDGFKDRYLAALPLFSIDSPPPPIDPPLGAISIPLGYNFSCPITGTLKGEPEVVPADILHSSAPDILSAVVADGTAIFDGLAIGQAEVKGPGFDATFTVLPPVPDQLSVDLAHGVYSKAAKSMVARVPVIAAMGLMVLVGGLASESDQRSTEWYPTEIAASPEAVTAILPSATNTTFMPPAAIASPPPEAAPPPYPTNLCLDPNQTINALERCLRWTDALSNL